MNPRNTIHLEGYVYDAPWTRVRADGSAQVRFKLVVQRLELQTDVFCCAVPVPSMGGVRAIEAQFHPGRTVALQGSARVTDVTSVRDEPLILIDVESYELDCQIVRMKPETRGRPRGKTAAAGDVESFQLIAS